MRTLENNYFLLCTKLGYLWYKYSTKTFPEKFRKFIWKQMRRSPIFNEVSSSKATALWKETSTRWFLADFANIFRLPIIMCFEWDEISSLFWKKKKQKTKTKSATTTIRWIASYPIKNHVFLWKHIFLISIPICFFFSSYINLVLWNFLW